MTSGIRRALHDPLQPFGRGPRYGCSAAKPVSRPLLPLKKAQCWAVLLDGTIRHLRPYLVMACKPKEEGQLPRAL
jgi:hypothetical protein